jgi:hypothetical protein
MHCQQRLFGTAFSLGAILIGLAASGCQTLDSNLAAVLAEPTAEPARAAAPESGDAVYYIEFRPDRKKPVIVGVPLNEVTYVQGALEKSGALKKFRRAKIEIYRHLPQGGGHKIPIDYNRRNRRVESGTDYAIHPRDRIVVTEDTSTVLDDMIDSMGGFLGT